MLGKLVRPDLRVDVSGRLVAGTGGVLVGTNHCGVYPDRPLAAFGHVGVAAQLVEDLFPDAIG